MDAPTSKLQTFFPLDIYRTLCFRPCYSHFFFLGFKSMSTFFFLLIPSFCFYWDMLAHALYIKMHLSDLSPTCVAIKLTSLVRNGPNQKTLWWTVGNGHTWDKQQVDTLSIVVETWSHYEGEWSFSLDRLISFKSYLSQGKNTWYF